MADALREQLTTDNGGRSGFVTVDNKRIIRLSRGLTHDSEIIITFDDNGTETHGFLVHVPYTEVAGPFANQLSLELTPTGDTKTSQPFNETSPPGVFEVGDSGTPLKAVSQALAMGAFTAAGLTFQMCAEQAVVG